ncbi:MAG TPA: hypothetical protein VJN02_07940 [Gammaproteobacteria bacterium]|nr:hypothetical protein [Gammaproteobacteria bacterium]
MSRIGIKRNGCETLFKVKLPAFLPYDKDTKKRGNKWRKTDLISIYRYIQIYQHSSKKHFIYWIYIPAMGEFKQYNNSFLNERKAAIDVDKQLILRGRKPVNVLKSIVLPHCSDVCD